MNNNGLSSWVKTLLHLSSYIIWKKHFCWKAINFLMPSLNNSCYNAFGNRMQADNRNVYSKIKKRSYPRITIFASCFDINWPFTNYHMLGIVYLLWFLYFTGCQHPLTIFFLWLVWFQVFLLVIFCWFLLPTSALWCLKSCLLLIKQC